MLRCTLQQAHGIRSQQDSKWTQAAASRSCCHSLIPSSNPSSCWRRLLKQLIPARLKTNSASAQKWSSSSRVFPKSYSKTSSTCAHSYQRALPSFVLLSWKQRFLPTKPLPPVTSSLFTWLNL